MGQGRWNPGIFSVYFTRLCVISLHPSRKVLPPYIWFNLGAVFVSVALLDFLEDTGKQSKERERLL